MKNQVKELIVKVQELSTLLTRMEPYLLETLEQEPNLLSQDHPQDHPQNNPQDIPSPVLVSELERLWDNQDLSIFLKVSICTLQRYRAEGLLPNRSAKKKNYYLNSDIIEFVKKMEAKKPKKKETPQRATKASQNEA